jgi:hypothetical protein
VTYETNTAFYKTNISEAQIERATHAKESRPVEHDPEGNWGPVLEGFQLSIRLEKASFTNGEPVIARMLLRNVTNSVRTYLVSSTHDPEDTLVLFRDEARVPRADEPKPGASFVERLKGIRNGSTWHCPSPPGTQRRFVADLSKIFDLTNGNYTVFAQREIQDLTHLVITNVVSDKASFTVLPAAPRN